MVNDTPVNADLIKSLMLHAALGFIMLGMGMSRPLSDFKRVFASTKAKLVGLMFVAACPRGYKFLLSQHGSAWRCDSASRFPSSLEYRTVRWRWRLHWHVGKPVSHHTGSGLQFNHIRRRRGDDSEVWARCTESDSFLNHPHPAIGLIESTGFFVDLGLTRGRSKIPVAQELGICFPAFLLHEVGK